MPETEPPASLPHETIERIIAAAKPDANLPAETVEALRGWLFDALAGAVRRAAAIPLTRTDVAKLERAYLRFAYIIDTLQDRDDPPPRLPVRESGETEWESWIAGVSVFGFRQVRIGSTDWRLIAQLLAFYETVSGKPASAAQPDGPTLCFLETVMEELASQAPASAASHFAVPEQEALKKQLYHPPVCSDKCSDHCDGNSFLRGGIKRLKKELDSPSRLASR